MSAADYPARGRYMGAVAREYVERRADSAKWRREQHVVEAMVAALPAPGLVLDVPFGTGRFAGAYARAGHRVLGLDISGDMLREAGAVTGSVAPAPSLVQADAEALPLRDDAVDYLVCTRFLNWLPGPAVDRVVGEFCRVARRGVILHVRVARPVRAGELLPLAAARVRWAPVRIASRLRRLARTWLRLGRTSGYTVHTEEAITDLFARHHAVVEEVRTVGNRLMYSRGERQALRVYRLRTRPPQAAP